MKIALWLFCFCVNLFASSITPIGGGGGSKFVSGSGVTLTVPTLDGATVVTSMHFGNCQMAPAQSNLGNSNTAVTFDLSKANIFTTTLNSATPSINIINPQVGCPYVFVLTQDSAGSRVPTFSGTNIVWGNSGLNTLSTAINAVDQVSCFYNGSTTKLMCNLVTGYQ